ncbi:MAG: hypothetical protein RL308_345 [Bacteroidota bacterium]|jgi:hypothetical protein
MQRQNQLPKIKKHDLTVGAFWQRETLLKNEACMTVKLLFRHGGKNGFDNCWIEMIHDLLTKKGNVFNEIVV